jgi:uncharacterized protein (DUF1501 family)
MPVLMTRREFVRGGVAAFTVGLSAPAFLSDLAQAQSLRRNLVVLYFSGGNDALSFLVPYTDQQYYDRRPTLAVPAGTVLQVGSDSAGNALGLHPRLTGLRSIFNSGRLAIIQRAGYPNSSRSHFQGTDIWSTADPSSPQGFGWLGRYLDTLGSPVDPLTAWATVRETPRTLLARTVGVPSIPDVAQYSFQSPNGVTDTASRATALRLSSHLPIDQPHLAFVNATEQAALATLDRVATVTTYAPTVTYPNDGLSSALKTVAAAISKEVGTRIFWVQIGGFDTHANQGTNLANGTYPRLLSTFDGALLAFHNDLRNQGLLNETLVIQFSEFGRRIDENASTGTDHGAAGVMLALGAVRGGLFGTAPKLRIAPDNQTLENNSNDVRYETDFRSVYATVIDSWLGADSVSILGGNFRGGPAFV